MFITINYLINPGSFSLAVVCTGIAFLVCDDILAGRLHCHDWSIHQSKDQLIEGERCWCCRCIPSIDWWEARPSLASVKTFIDVLFVSSGCEDIHTCYKCILFQQEKQKGLCLDCWWCEFNAKYVVWACGWCCNKQPSSASESNTRYQNAMSGGRFFLPTMIFNSVLPLIILRSNYLYNIYYLGFSALFWGKGRWEKTYFVSWVRWSIMFRYRVNSINAPSTIDVVSHYPLMFNLSDPFPSYYKRDSTHLLLIFSVKNHVSIS